jgi:hypothetical protein
MKVTNLFLSSIYILSIIFSTQSFGQDNRNRVQIGIKAGTNFANVYDTQGEDFRADGKFGFVGGGFLSLPLGSVVGVQPEVLFSQKGFRATGSLLGSNYGLTRTTNFIDIPLYLTVKPTEAVTLLFGPQFSYLMRRKDVFKSGLGSVTQIDEFNNDNIRKNIFGLAGGLDFNFNPMILGIRAGWDLSTNNGDGTSSTPRYKNTVLQATLGFRFL